jgi:hypothetical protein
LNIIATKARAHGTEALLLKSEWCAPEDIQGHDPDVLLAPTMELAFARILERWQPRKPIALVSLCTSTRPYSRSRKWAAYRAMFGGKADLIICSNGGVIPIAYENAFPFLNYDAHGESQYDKLYIEVVSERLLRFFTAARYRFVLFNFRHNMRNVHCANAVAPVLKAAGAFEDFAILPSRADYDAGRAAGFSHASPAVQRVPELYPNMLNPVVAQIAKWSFACKAAA